MILLEMLSQLLNDSESERTEDSQEGNNVSKEFELKVDKIARIMGNMCLAAAGDSKSPAKDLENLAEAVSKVREVKGLQAFAWPLKRTGLDWSFQP